jgi:hypothetical protein
VYRHFVRSIIIVCALELLSNAFVMLGSPYTSLASGDTWQVCGYQIESLIEHQSSALSLQTALTTAEHSPTYVSVSKSSNLTDVSEYDLWHFTDSCTLFLNSVNLVFGVYNNSMLKSYLVVSETPNLAAVLGITNQTFPSSYSGGPFLGPWSGYNFWNGTVDSTPMYEATTTINLPSVYAPSGLCWWPSVCEVGFWIGLSNEAAAENGLVQTGFAGQVYCAVYRCYPTYFGWYQWDPTSKAIQCSGFSINPGDSVGANIQSEGIAGGNPYTYDAYLVDNSNNQVCHASQTVSSMGTPYFADFMAEDGGHTLAGFTPSVDFTYDEVYYGGNYHSIAPLYAAGTFNTYYLEQNGCGSPDITVGGIDSAGNFQQTYMNSCGTP